MKTGQTNKAIQEQPERKGERKAFMYPANREYPKAVTVWAFSQEEADKEYQKIVKGANI